MNNIQDILAYFGKNQALKESTQCYVKQLLQVQIIGPETLSSTDPSKWNKETVIKVRHEIISKKS